MKITSQQVYNLRKKPNNITKIGSDKSPLNNNDLNFGSNFPAKLVATVAEDASVTFSKAKNKITATNAKKLINNLDNLFGENTFLTKLIQAGGDIDLDANKLSVPNRSFLKDDLFKTLLFPVDIFTSLAEKLSKKGNFQYKEDGFIQKLINKKHQTQARDWVLDTIEEFSQRQYEKELDLNKFTTKFEDVITSNGTKIKKGYATRDERTLNRIVTSCVSAMYAGWDFYNISMLEKDNKKDAKEAQKGRLKQELTRMAFNASVTFLALGALDRYTKRSIVLNSIVIAGGALIAEIASRLMSGTPLKSLTPQEAAKIAQLRKERKAQKEQIQNNQNSAQKVQFKANIKTQNEIFSDFATNGNIKALDVQKKSINQNTIPLQSKEAPKKKIKIGKILGIAFGAATAIFFGAKALRGDFKAIKQQREFLEHFGGDSMKENLFSKNVNIAFKRAGIFIKNIFKHTNKQPQIEFLEKKLDLSALDDEALKEARKISEKIAREHKDATDSFSFWSNLQKLLTTTKTSQTTEQVISELEDLKNLKKHPRANEIEGILEAYIKHAKQYADEGNKIVESRKEIFLVSGVIKGFSKLFKTIYDILTLPARMLNGLAESITGADINRKAFNKANKQLNPSAKGYKDELSGIYQTIQKAKKSNNPEKMNELIDTIKERARNVETSQETSDLANMSRTMVTAIGTIFFVNDYKNNVLIESEGRNIEGAKEEAKERVWHKVFNFIINGTLMNVFNTTFGKIVNGSLPGAAIIASLTELTNEFLIRKSLCQPVLPQDSKQAIIDFETAQMEKEGIWGAWSRFFKKITGKKNLTQKAGIKTQKATQIQKEETALKKIEAHQG